MLCLYEVRALLLNHILSVHIPSINTDQIMRQVIKVLCMNTWLNSIWNTKIFSWNPAILNYFWKSGMCHYAYDVWIIRQFLYCNKHQHFVQDKATCPSFLCHFFLYIFVQLLLHTHFISIKLQYRDTCWETNEQKHC